MAISRLRRTEDRIQRRRIGLAIFGTIFLFVFLALFGVRFLIWFSLLIDKMRGNSPTPTPTQTLILPPELDPLPEATFSASMPVTGRAPAGTTVILYIDGSDTRRLPADKDGTFKFTGVPFKDGTNTVSAKVSDGKGGISELSEVLSVIVKTSKPKLDVSSPSDGTKVTGDSNLVTVSGKTEENARVTVNDRFVVVRQDGSFTYEYPLKEGEQKLTIVVTDIAGNTEKTERNVTYSK